MADPRYIVNAAGDIEQASAPAYAKWMTATVLDRAAAAVAFVQKYLRTGGQAAREQVPDDQFTSGSALGFVTSLLGWDWPKAVNAFGRFRHFQVYKTDAASNFIHVRAFNRGLAAGFRLAQAFSDSARAAWLSAIRRLANLDHYPDDVTAGSPSVPGALGFVIGLATALQSNLIKGLSPTKEYTADELQQLNRDLQKLAQLQAIIAHAIDLEAHEAEQAVRNMQ